MNAFSRGFNGKQVGVAGGIKTGPVNLSQGPSAPVATPALGVQPPAPQAKAACALPQKGAAAAPKLAAAPQTPPGAIPTGSKANCPVCRTFGG